MINDYYILENDEKQGPFTHQELIESGLQADTFILSPYNNDLWAYAAALPEFYRYFEEKKIYHPAVVTPAGFWWRFLAYLIDNVLIVLLFIPIGSAAALIIGLYYPDHIGYVDSAEFDVITRIFSIVFSMLYNSLFESLSTQGSIGKVICKLVVVDNFGNRLKFSAAFQRNIAKLFSGLILGVGYLSIFWDSNKQTWHDHFAKAHVLRKR